MPAVKKGGDFFSGESLYGDVIKYSQFGEHRTATKGDEETTEWIVKELESAGVRTSSESFPVETYFGTETKLTVGEHAVDCFPLWPPRWTEPEGIRGHLVSCLGNMLTKSPDLFQNRVGSCCPDKGM
jgi:hypothetical protein